MKAKYDFDSLYGDENEDDRIRKGLDWLLINELVKDKIKTRNESGTARKAFVPQKMRCKLCDSVFFSKYSGHFASCKCGKCSIDQTECYTRWIGNIGDMEELSTDSSASEEVRPSTSQEEI